MASPYSAAASTSWSLPATPRAARSSNCPSRLDSIPARTITRRSKSSSTWEGDVNLRSGERFERGGPGSFFFVPSGTVHSYGNPGPAPARVLFMTSPPGFEQYFEELAQLVAKGGRPDPESLAQLCARHDTIPALPAPPASGASDTTPSPLASKTPNPRLCTVAISVTSGV